MSIAPRPEVGKLPQTVSRMTNSVNIDRGRMGETRRPSGVYLIPLWTDLYSAAVTRMVAYRMSQRLKYDTVHSSPLGSS